jgi:hypothetical protein
VPVSPENHRDLCVKSGADFNFAAKVDSVPLIAAEFGAAAAEYAIVFAGSEEQVVPAVLLGMAPGQDLYVAADGHRDAAYVPAFVRRYPLVFALSKDGKTFTLCVDENYDGCNRDGRRERLFDADGERTSYLDGVMGLHRFRGAIQAHRSVLQAPRRTGPAVTGQSAQARRTRGLVHGTSGAEFQCTFAGRANSQRLFTHVTEFDPRFVYYAPLNLPPAATPSSKKPEDTHEYDSRIRHR